MFCVVLLWRLIVPYPWSSDLLFRSGCDPVYQGFNRGVSLTKNTDPFFGRCFCSEYIFAFVSVMGQPHAHPEPARACTMHLLTTCRRRPSPHVGSALETAEVPHGEACYDLASSDARWGKGWFPPMHGYRGGGIFFVSDRPSLHTPKHKMQKAQNTMFFFNCETYAQERRIGQGTASLEWQREGKEMWHHMFCMPPSQITHFWRLLCALCRNKQSLSNSRSPPQVARRCHR